jgi:DNA-binding LacI/PurR family transcriptional regulator
MVGFDDIEEARYSIPTLTSVNPCRTDIARAAVDLLVERMAGAGGAQEEVVAPYRLMVRESTVGVEPG